MKQVVLLGTAPASMALAPIHNPDWDVWSCSPGTYPFVQTAMKETDRHFELHRYEPNQEWFSGGYIEFLKAYKGSVIMSEGVQEIPNCVILDWPGYVSKYGPYFFTSSLAWMMAMAIEEKYDRIALYGVDMAATTEYENQRMGCQYFAQLAAAKGIEVGVPPESDLFRPAPLYGVCETSHVWIKQRARNIEMKQRLDAAQQTIKEKTTEMHFLQGALDDQDWQLHSWFGNLDTQGKIFTTVPSVPSMLAEPSAMPPTDGRPVSVTTGKTKVSVKKKRGRPKK